MNKITLNGEKDYLFTDDRDARVEKMNPKDRVPSYGSNDLYPPKRALTPSEADLFDQIGTTPPPAVPKP